MQAVLIDLDGVLYVGNEPVAGAAETVHWLVEAGVPHLFLTNTTSRPIRVLVEKLEGMGIDAKPDAFLTPARAASRWIGEHVDGAPALLVPEPTWEDLPAPAAEGEIPAAVVVGDLGEAWNYATLNRAFRWLMDAARPPLLALGMTRYWKAPDGLRLDVGGIVRALEYAADCRAVVLGKPSPDFFKLALSILGTAAEETLMIGDDIRGDVAGAQAAGLRAALVRTGKFAERDLQLGVKPDAVWESIATLREAWADCDL